MQTPKPPKFAHAVPLRRPMGEHARRTVVAGVAHVRYSPEAALVLVAALGFSDVPLDELQIAALGGRAHARAAVDRVLAAAERAQYSRLGTLRFMLTNPPFGPEALSAVEHFSEECGVDLVLMGVPNEAFFSGWEAV